MAQKRGEFVSMDERGRTDNDVKKKRIKEGRKGTFSSSLSALFPFPSLVLGEGTQLGKGGKEARRNNSTFF